MFNALISKGMSKKPETFFKDLPDRTTTVREETALKAATSTTGTIEYSPYSVFPVGTIIRVAPVGHKLFGYDPQLTFKVGKREYTDQTGLYVFLNEDDTATAVHFMGSFRNRPAYSTNGDVDLLDQLLVQKKVFKIKGFTPEGVKTYIEDPVPCTDFDDDKDINYLRFGKAVSDWKVIETLAGGKWKVTHHVIAETRIFRKGLPPRQHHMHIPILKRIGEWDDQ